MINLPGLVCRDWPGGEVVRVCLSLSIYLSVSLSLCLSVSLSLCLSLSLYSVSLSLSLSLALLLCGVLGHPVSGVIYRTPTVLTFEQLHDAAPIPIAILFKKALLIVSSGNLGAVPKKSCSCALASRAYLFPHLHE